MTTGGPAGRAVSLALAVSTSFSTTVSLATWPPGTWKKYIMKLQASRKWAATMPTSRISEKREFLMAGRSTITRAVPERVAAVITSNHCRNENYAWKGGEPIIQERKLL